MVGGLSRDSVTDAGGASLFEDELWSDVMLELKTLLDEGVSPMSAARTVAQRHGLPRGHVHPRAVALAAEMKGNKPVDTD